MIFNDDFDELKTVWRKNVWFVGKVQKQRLTKGRRVVEVVSFKLFGWDVSFSKTVAK